MNNIKKFNELNEEINWLGKDNYDTNPVEYCGMILSSSII